MGRPRAGPPGLTDDLTARARAWAERSCLDQQLPVKITEARTLREVASLLGAGGRDARDSAELSEPRPVCRSRAFALVVKETSERGRPGRRARWGDLTST